MVHRCLLYTSETIQDEYNAKSWKIKEKIEEIQRKEITKIREEIEILNSRPMNYTPIPIGENREAISFKEYQRNPLEFIDRLEELINRIKENRWTMIKNILDESFKHIYDNLCSAIRNELHNYNEFKQAFKTKYWSCLLYTSRCV